MMFQTTEHLILRRIPCSNTTDLFRSVCARGYAFWFTLPLLFILLTAVQGQAQPRNILYFNSYHVGYKWSDEIYQGFLDTLAPVAENVSLHVEYLDMKRHYSDERYKQLAESIAHKYKGIQIDLLVSADDSAFIFLKEYGHVLFPGIPVFFCGTNYLEQNELHGFPNFYGITEKANIEETFSTILNIFPDTRTIYIINDRTVTGLKVLKQIEQAIQSYENRVSFTLWDDISMPDLITNVNNIPSDSIVFYTFFFRDKTGQSFEHNQSMSLIYRQCPVPIFGAWDFNLGHGLVGGMLTSGSQQGKAVAQLVISWLEGAPLHTLPRLTSSPNRFMFDYVIMKKYKIKTGQLPKDSIILNSPASFYQKHSKVINLSAIFISALLLVIAFMTVNILQRRKVERKLRQSEENFRSIFTNANDGLYQADADGHFIRVNPALAAMLKFDGTEEMLNHYTDIDHQLYTSPADRQAFLARLKDTGWAKGEHRLYCRDDSIIDVIENTHSVTDAKGRFLFYEGSITDMTEYKKTQELIVQTEKVISLGGVSAGIAHEIRSPLTTIIQSAQVARDRVFENTPENLQCARECGMPLETLRDYLRKRSIHEMLENIIKAGKRCATIIEDMLSFSRKSIGDFALESLEELIDSSLDLAVKDYTLTTQCRFQQIRIHKEVEDSLPLVYCNSNKIRQVFFNIFKNGAEAMTEAGTASPCFTLRLRKTNGSVRVEIEDNGPGMSQEQAQRIFDPFYTTKDRMKGTGLGLSVSYFIIKENHKGDLRVFSQPGLGSTFIIELPLEQGPTSTNTQAQETAPSLSSAAK